MLGGLARCIGRGGTAGQVIRRVGERMIEHTLIMRRRQIGGDELQPRPVICRSVSCGQRHQCRVLIDADAVHIRDPRGEAKQRRPGAAAAFQDAFAWLGRHASRQQHRFDAAAETLSGLRIANPSVQQMAAGGALGDCLHLMAHYSVSRRSSIRHSRESGNPGAANPVPRAWIPAFAGMTNEMRPHA